MKSIYRISVVTFLLCIGSAVHAQSTANTSKPILYLFLSDECIITQYYISTLNQLSAEYGQEIEMVAIFPNFSSKPKKIEAFYSKYQLAIPHKTDYYKKLSKSLGATVTPEAILLDSKGQIVYQGRIDNSYVAIGKRRRVVTTQELSDAMSSLIQEKEIEVSRTEAVGCFINFNDKISSNRQSEY